MSNSVAAIVAWLTEAHRDLKKLESDALAALYENEDEAAYRLLMRKRAERLAALDAEGKEVLKGVPKPLHRNVSQAVSRFSRGAQKSLELNSVFYMSLLLYPCGHQPGEPDNLECLIAEITAS